MSIFLTLLRRELAAFFFSIRGYVIVSSVTLLIGLSFVMLIRNLGHESPAPVTQVFFNSQLFWIVVVLVAPMITMRLFALEKASGTYETLMTTAVSDLQVVAAKFVAGLFFYMVMWLPTLGCLFLVAHFTNQANTLSKGLLVGLYTGIFLCGSLFIAIGCLASALTRSQVTAGMISLAMGVMLLIVGYLAYAEIVPAGGEWQTTSVLYYFNLFGQMKDFARGVVDSRAVLFYASGTFLFLFLTLRAVESRRWK